MPNLIDELSPARSAALFDTGAATDSYGALPMCRSKSLIINYDNVYSSQGVLLQPTAHALIPTGKVRKADEMAGMMAGNADLTACCSCKRGTKYSWMKCKIPICNLCRQPEFDDNVNGWLSGKQVGYCYSCSRKLNWKRTFLEDKTRRTKRNDEEDIREA